MAGYQGISKVSGVNITNIAKIGSITKDNIWSVSGEQRIPSLFKTLQNSDWASYTAGVNSASFVAVGSSSSRAFVYFQYDGHTNGDTYKFNFDKTGTSAFRTMACSISRDATFATDTSNLDISLDSGSVTKTITYNRGTGSTIYIGLIKDNASSTDTLNISNLTIIKQ
tara:strand:+ start:1639 stop:2142 length:504 start_codon:yes stop_codon:yes gene_type:complete